MTAVSRTIAERYTLLEELGRDGTAVLWRAEDGPDGDRVTIKELRLPGHEPALVERLQREARVALDHPSVVPVHDVVVTDGTAFIVMGPVEGRTLEDVAAAGPLPPRFVADLGGQVLGALTAAHTAGVVHGDVRPSNILVAPDGTVKLTGFGIAKALDPAGTPAFLAPETIAGHEATPHSDLWSVGVTMLSASEGGNFFQRANVAATLYAVVNEQPPFNRTPAPLADVLRGLLAKAPQARMLPDQALPLLAQAASGVETPVPQPSSPGLGMPSMPAILAGVASILFGFYVLTDAMVIHQAYLFDVFWPPMLLARVGIVLAGVFSIVGGGLLFASVRRGQVMTAVGAGLTLLSLLLLQTLDEREHLGRALQPGLTLDLVALVFAAMLVIGVWLVPAKRPAVG
ncbi:serine/threonine-protein kinase [Amycolatopsis roodepoortensis]|uniref:Drug/metabolite transporter superfamily protein YnfA n=1 Tax=Amycolatopsis roodepoortensis TaxID=700274 RepID=A0ABR9KZC9_9PSEU|nr:serine/threonine-protein kinase [Amycolatopsis roodepoortensis]MBE1573725.1 drug/metabolite transporter superfamily protein YnfA [Amycolatopsis roodepoortensis]